MKFFLVEKAFFSKGVPNIELDKATVLKTLLYCAYHHWKEGENLLHSPLAVKKVITISYYSR